MYFLAKGGMVPLICAVGRNVRNSLQYIQDMVKSYSSDEFIEYEKEFNRFEACFHKEEKTTYDGITYYEYAVLPSESPMNLADSRETEQLPYPLGIYDQPGAPPSLWC